MKWGFQDEFIALFARNHLPVLREQMKTGRIIDLRTYVPTYHGDGRADWTFAVVITYKGAGTTTSLSGLVADTSGAVIPGADVVTKNNATAAEFRAVTNNEGRFTIPALNPGTYTVTVSLIGFKTVILPDIDGICRGIIERKLEFRWGCEGRVDSVGIEQLPVMRQAGCTFLAFGVESGTQKVLNRLNKEQLLFLHRILKRPLRTWRLLRAFGRHMKTSDIVKLLGSPFRRRALTRKPELPARMMDAGLEEPDRPWRATRP